MTRQRSGRPGPAKKSIAPLNRPFIKTSILFLLFLQLLFVLPFDGRAAEDPPAPLPRQHASDDDIEMRLRQMVGQLIIAVDEQKDPADQLDALIREIDAMLAAFEEQKAQFDRIEEKLKQIGASDALDKHYRMVEKLDQIQAEMTGHLEAIQSARIQGGITLRQALEQFQKFIERHQSKEVRRPKAAESGLPWRLVEPQEIVLLGDASSLPASSVSLQSLEPPTADELASTIDAPITTEIRQLAQSMNNDPLEIFRYIHNQFDYVPYFGSKKGALATLYEKEGNDFDLASLLIALLRAADIPSRYVKARIVVPVHELKQWLDFQDPMAAVRYMSAAGGLLGHYTVAGETGYVGIEHVFVEAYLPYANYRGTMEDDSGSLWIPLDPSFKAYEVLQPGIDLVAEMGFDWRSFFDDFFNTLSNHSPMERYRQQVETFVADTYPGQTLDDLKRKTRIAVRQFDFLPNTLPYLILGVDQRFAAIPDGYRHTVRLAMSPLFDVTLNLPEVAGRRITLSFEGASEQDRAIVESYGDVMDTPAYLIEVVPQIKVDGQLVIQGDPVAAGVSRRLDMAYYQPGKEAELFDHDVVTGSYNGLGLTVGKVAERLLSISRVEDDDEPYMAKLVHSFAAKYHHQENLMRQLLNDTMLLKSQTFITEALVSTYQSRCFVFGVPRLSGLSGFTIDAQSRESGVEALDGKNWKKIRDFMMLSGLEASYQENRVFEDNVFLLGGLSAAKGLQVLNAIGVEVVELEPPNRLYNPALPYVVVDDINNALNKGWHVIVPKATGGLFSFPYIKYDPASGSAGYMIASAAGGRAVALYPMGHSIDLKEALFPYRQIISIDIEMPIPPSPHIVAMGEMFNVMLRYSAVYRVGSTTIGTNRESYIIIDTDRDHYSPGYWPLFTLAPGEYTYKFDGSILFVFRVWNVDMEIAEEENLLAISTENGQDTITEPLQINYTIENVQGVSLSSVNLKVYRSSDEQNPIRTIALPASMGAGTATWDGKDDAGQVVAPGVYTFHIEAEGTGGTTESNGDKVTVVKAELKQDDTIVDEENVSFISAEPQMPNLRARIKPEDEDLSVKWRLEIHYHEGSILYDDYFPGPDQNEWVSLAGTQEWNIKEAFGERFLGGDAILIYRIGEKVERRIEFKIWGKNAQQSEVRKIATKLRHQLVAWWESRFQQFKETPSDVWNNPFEEGPLPVLRTFDNGFGIMQITCEEPRQFEIWNWQFNVIEGVDRLENLTSNALTYNDQVQQGLSWNSQTGGDPPREGSSYPEAPEFTQDELDMETWSRYNSGYRYYDYNPFQGTWERRPSTSGGMEYAERLAGYRDNIRNKNQYPPIWGEN